METVIALIVVGAVLIFLETLLPGLIAGILGVVCLAAAVVVAFTRFGVETGAWVLMGVMAGLVAGGAAYAKFFPDSAVARRFVSRSAIGELGAERPELVNQTGVAHSNLRPSGTALINGRRVDVVTEGPLIERGTAVKVIAVEGMRVVVRALDPAPSAAPASTKPESTNL